jgi:hypothetical protein
MYSVFTRDRDGEFLFVMSRADLKEAVELTEELNVNWPHEYVVRDSIGNDVYLKKGPALHSNPRSAYPSL